MKYFFASLLMISNLSFAATSTSFVCKSQDNTIGVEFKLEEIGISFFQFIRDFKVTMIETGKELMLYPNELLMGLESETNPVKFSYLIKGNIMKKNILGKQKAKGTFEFVIKDTDMSENGKNGIGKLKLVSNKSNAAPIHTEMLCEAKN